MQKSHLCLTMLGMSVNTLPQRRRIPRDTFALRLVALRHDLELSQEQIADLCGFKRPTWATWENGVNPRAQASVANKIARATGYDRDWLLYGNEDSPTPGPSSVPLPGGWRFDSAHRLTALKIAS